MDALSLNVEYESNVSGNKNPCLSMNDTLARMIEVDKELWSCTLNYDVKTNQEAMMKNIQQNDLDPFYYMKLDHSSDDEEEDDSFILDEQGWDIRTFHVKPLK